MADDLAFNVQPASLSIASRYDVSARAFARLSSLCAKPDFNFSDQLGPLTVQDEFGRLRVWAGNIGAHRIGRVSLDYRLREASHMCKQVTTLLDELNRTLEEGMNSASSTSGSAVIGCLSLIDCAYYYC